MQLRDISRLPDRPIAADTAPMVSRSISLLSTLHAAAGMQPVHVVMVGMRFG
ncbi:MAG TPA: hypothetical protein VJN68_11160 [Burkholderiaceae bacterium]|nr:hypothetical protein [Burkholderiaceae bacterium]